MWMLAYGTMLGAYRCAMQPATAAAKFAGDHRAAQGMGELFEKCMRQLSGQTICIYLLFF